MLFGVVFDCHVQRGRFLACFLFDLGSPKQTALFLSCSHTTCAKRKTLLGKCALLQRSSTLTKRPVFVQINTRWTEKSTRYLNVSTTDPLIFSVLSLSTSCPPPPLSFYLYCLTRATSASVLLFICSIYKIKRKCFYDVLSLLKLLFLARCKVQASVQQIA